jgi:fibronectin-binding autotransporter adhesin
VPGSYIHVTGGIGKTLELAGDITVTGKIAYLSANPGSSDIPALHNVEGDNVWAGTVRLHGDDGPRQISVDGGTSLTASQGIYAGYTNELIKRGAGLLTLAAPSSGDFVTRVEEGTLALVGNAHLNTNATIFVGEGATLDVSGVTSGPYALANAQTLHGNGTVFGDLDVAAGSTISGGASPGHLTVDGDLVLGDDATPALGGTLLAEIAGTIPGDPAGHDWLEVNGTATLAAGATIDVDLLGGFMPEAGDVFDILTATGGITNADLAGVTLDFSDAELATGRWMAEIVGLGGGAEALRLTGAVPEPGSCLLAVLGLIGVLLLGRQRSIGRQG